MPRNTQTDKRYSVCIGINIYAPETDLGSLNCAENDAQKMDEMLGRLGFAPENRILLLGEAATLDAVNKALGTMIFNQSKENDLVLVYFAGHSTPVTVKDRPEGRESEVFLATFDFNRQLIKDDLFFRSQSALGMERLRNIFFEGPGSRKRLFIFDSCYSGDFYGPSYRDGTEQVPGYVQYKMNSGTDGRLFLASCLPYKKATESIIHGHGQFTYYLLKALGGETDDAVRKDGTLTAGSLFDYLDDQLKDQKPVRGGVEFGSFILTRHPHLAATEANNPLDEDEVGKEAHLREKWIDQQDFVQDLVGRFVGRQIELDQLQKRIDGQMERGGYVIITGVAGQGKSSIIAQMIKNQGIDKTAYHFIQFNSGPEHQFSLLRSLMARLILNYHLPERYVAGESYPILRDYFLKILKEISDKHAREVIYIDGLDQLETSASVRRDLSFLPTQLPPGIVMVVGTRPNETLSQLQELPGMEKPYTLPGLSREDFLLLLQRHEVLIPPALSDLLSEKLKQNPLYLGLVVQELVAQTELQTEALIARIENNPDNIFGITFSRLQQLPDWSDIVRPMLGTLLVAQEPLSGLQMAHILGKADVHIRSGAKHLGGLLVSAGQQKYVLFHGKLGDYLGPGIVEPDNDIQFSIEEVQKLHRNMAHWCEQRPLEELWLAIPGTSSTNDYQEYARRHYITHLYGIGNHERLFEVLNTGNYERNKLRADPSTRSSAADLMLGCRAAAQATETLDEGKKLLFHLWRYTLLRTSLATQADNYPIEFFGALLVQDKENEALGLAELLTQPERKLAVLTLITRYLLTQPSREKEGLQLYSRTYEIATTIENSQTKTKALRELAAALIQVGQLIRAEEVARELTDSYRAETLYDISAAYSEQGYWQKAAEVAHVIIWDDEQQVRALSNLAACLYLANEKEEAERFWQEASAIISTIPASEEQNKATYHLAIALLQAQEWTKANETIHLITSGNKKIIALSQLALSLTQTGLISQAETAWEEVQRSANAPTETSEQDQAQQIYAMALAQAEFWDNAKTIALRKITNPTNKIVVFSSLALSLAKKGGWEQSKRIIVDLIAREYNLTDVAPSILDDTLISLSVNLAREQQWEQAKEAASTIPRKEAQCRALLGIVVELVQAGIREEAQIVWSKARAMCIAQKNTVQVSVAGTVVTVLVETGQLSQAKEILENLPDKQTKEYIREEIAVALAKAGKIVESEEIANDITNAQSSIRVTRAIAVAQMRVEQVAQAIETAKSISHEEVRSYALDDLVTISCQMQQWDLAQKIANQISSGPVQGEALNRIIIGLVKNGHLSKAREIIRTIDNEYRKANALCNLITAYAQIGGLRAQSEKFARTITSNERIRLKAMCNIYVALGQPGLAVSFARSIPESDEKVEALCNTAIAFARAQLWKQAEEVAEEINDVRIQDKAWGGIAKELAQAKQWMRALATFDKIQNNHQRKAVLQAWGTVLVPPANTALSERIVHHLNRSEEKSSLLVSIANALAQIEDELEQIRLIQRSWLQASTKDDCQYLFAMARGILLRNPEICADFYASFDWADRFIE